MNAVAQTWRDPDTRRYFTAANTHALLTDTIERQYVNPGSPVAHAWPEGYKLDQIERLRDNWDSRGSAAPSIRAIESARVWIDVLRRTATLAGRLWAIPHISAGAAGEVTFEWWRKDRKITIYFSDGPPEFVQVWGAHIQDEMTSGELRSNETFRTLWVWLNA